MITIDTIFQNPFYIAVAMFIGAIIYIIIRRTGKMPYVAQDALLTKSELYFYQTLKLAAPDHSLIMMKVRMADIITCTDAQWNAGWGSRISAKHIDFVIIDAKTTAIICAIELDDSTHRTHHDRMARDKFVNKAFEVAGVKLMRVDTSKRYSVSELINKLSA